MLRAPARLSLVVPTWNEASRLPRLLAATLGAEDAGDRPDEVVVADGGSTDRTCDLARAAGARLVSSDLGRGTQLAAGAAAASGDLLAFVHADACPRPGALALVRAAFGDAGVEAAAFHQEIEAPGRVYRWIERVADRRARRGWVYGDSGLVLRRALYEGLGGFRDQPLFEDLDLARRLRARVDVLLVPGAVLTVCPRRWQREGAVRASVRNWALTRAWRLGVPPERLARWYPREGGPSAGAPDETG